MSLAKIGEKKPGKSSLILQARQKCYERGEELVQIYDSKSLTNLRNYLFKHARFFTPSDEGSTLVHTGLYVKGEWAYFQNGVRL